MRFTSLASVAVALALISLPASRAQQASSTSSVSGSSPTVRHGFRIADASQHHRLVNHHHHAQQRSVTAYQPHCFRVLKRQCLVHSRLHRGACVSECHLHNILGRQRHLVRLHQGRKHITTTSYHHRPRLWCPWRHPHRRRSSHGLLRSPQPMVELLPVGFFALALICISSSSKSASSLPSTLRPRRSVASSS